MRLATIGATMAAVTAFSAGTALAWHPHGVITKGVTNVTAGSTAVSAADTTSTAVSAKPGDTLRYTIVINNDSPTTNSYDDLGFTKLTDTLPAGVELVSGQTTETIGTIKAKQSVTRIITVKVKSTVKDGDILDNQACFTGEATNHEAGTQQSGCDHAIVKVTVPKTTPSPSPSPSPKPSPSPSPKPIVSPTPTPTPGKGEVLSTQAPTTLPDTGMTDLLGTTAGLGAMTAATVAYLRSRKNR